MKLHACLLCAVMLVAGSPMMAGAAVTKAKSSTHTSLRSDKRSARTAPHSNLRAVRRSLHPAHTHRAAQHSRQHAHHATHSRAGKGHLG
jgi:hypothetical protein